MLIKRDTSGLKTHAQKKRGLAFERAEAGIAKLQKEGRPVTFTTVAEIAGVSRAWLYSQSTIKARIEALKGQKTPTKESAPGQNPAASSKVQIVVKALSKRIENLEAENLGLRSQLTVVHGQTNPELVEIIENQQYEIEELTKQNQRTMKLLDQTRRELEYLRQDR